MVHKLEVLPDDLIVQVCLDYDTIESAADVLDVSWSFLAADIKRRGLRTHFQIRRAHGLPTRRPAAVKPPPPAFVLAIAEGRITRTARNLGTDLRSPFPGVL